jgi:hypothetical protein
VRKERETDPVIPLLDECRERARAAEAEGLSQRLDELLAFVHLFDRGIGTLVRTDPDDLGRLFRVLGRLDERTVDRLLATLASLPEEELAAAARTLGGMPRGTLQKVIRLAGRPALARFLVSRG